MRRVKYLKETEACENFVSEGSTLRDLIEQSSGSGSGLPLLVGSDELWLVGWLVVSL